MNYKLTFEKSAEKFIRKQDKLQQSRIMKALLQLPGKGDIKHLAGTGGLYRVRISELRAIFSINEDARIVNIESIGPRGQVYNRI